MPISNGCSALARGQSKGTGNAEMDLALEPFQVLLGRL